MCCECLRYTMQSEKKNYSLLWEVWTLPKLCCLSCVRNMINIFLEKNMNNVITLMLENNQRYDLAVSMYVECVISSCVCRLIWPNHILIVAKPQWGCSHPGFSQAWTTVNRQVNWMRRRDVSMPWVSRELHRAKIIFPPSQIKLISRVVVARKRNVCNSALPTG
jgi:hypothetical protein